MACQPRSEATTTSMLTIFSCLGRSASACKQAYEMLLQRQPYILAHIQSTGSPGSRKKKRPTPGGEVTVPAERSIQPRPVTEFATVNTPDDLSMRHGLAQPAIERQERQGKKRGRPSKAEQEARAAQAAERGEVYPPPKKLKTPRPSIEGTAPMAMMTVSAPTETEVGASPLSYKKARLGEAPVEAGIQSLQATASAADRMHEGASRETVPETHASEFEAPESLLSGMKEHAARTAEVDVQMQEPETAQSSVTVQQQYSAPEHVQQHPPPEQQHSVPEHVQQYPPPEHGAWSSYQR